MRKGISLLLALLMALSGLAAAEEETAAVTRDLEHLTVGNPTPITGIFFTDLWGTGTSDVDVRNLIHGYNLVRWVAHESRFNVDPSVVTGMAVTENEEGDRTFILVLAGDLVYSDGTPVTAYDYAFSILLQISPAVNQLGGHRVRKEYLLGCEEYVNRNAQLLNTRIGKNDAGKVVEQVISFRNAENELTSFSGQTGILYRNAEGELSLAEAGAPIHVDAQGIITDWHYEQGVRVYENGGATALTGVRILAEDMLAITISHEYLPFFYELGLLSCVPYPVSVIVPGVEIRDDGNGIYLANKEAGDEPAFTAELLKKTILDPETGYLYHPAVGSGPYLLKSFDGVTAELEINPLYKGDSEGMKPSIPRLTYTLAENETMVEKLATSELDVLNKVTRADTITNALNLMMTGTYGEEQISQEPFRMTNYPRSGLSMVSFLLDRPTVSSAAVRKAMAWCMNRDQIVLDYTGGFGQRVDGYYGLGQWQTELVNETIDFPVTAPEDENDQETAAAFENELAEWEGLNLDELVDYEVNLDEAAFWLSSDGWELNSEGIREKNGVRLELTLGYPEGNIIADSFARNWIPNLEQVGIRLTLEPLFMGEVLALYNGHDEAHPEVDMIYLACNFDLIFDPTVQFAPEKDREFEGRDELYRLALDMRQTEPGDFLSYMKKWVAFEKCVNDMLPMIPLYSNIYFDFYTALLQNYQVSEMETLGQSIVRAEMRIPEELPAEDEMSGETESEDDEGTAFFD